MFKWGWFMGQAQASIDPKAREKELESKFEEFVRLYREISYEYSKFLERIPWNYSKVCELFPRLKALAEELLREYEAMGSPRVNGIRMLYAIAERAYSYASQ